MVFIVDTIFSLFRETYLGLLLQVKRSVRINLKTVYYENHLETMGGTKNMKQIAR